MTISEFHENLKTKKITAREAVFSMLEKIKKENKKLNAYLEVFEKDALEAATEVDRRIAEGEEPGILWGVPLAIKDNILIKGEVASSSSKILENYISSYDATVIKKLRERGAIFLGRTNMDEFAMGASTENSAYGPTKNPHDISRVPGGSSGGSAAAVAADLALAALGSDTGGSVRQPAAFCGAVGLKPTYGAVSRHGLMAMASSLDQIGPIAKTVSDAEILFNSIKGQDELDSTSTNSPEVKENPTVKKIGIPKEYFGEGLDDRIRKSIEDVIQKLKNHNYEIKEISLPHTDYSIAAYYIVVPAEVSSNMARYDGVRYGERAHGENLLEVYKKSRGAGLGLEVRRRILLGTYVLSHGYYDAYYAKAGKVRILIKEDFRKAFNEVDLILCPTTPTLPFKIGERAEDPLSMYLADIYTSPANLAGVPALSMPISWTEEGGKKLPMSLQLIAPHFGEERLFKLGKEIESWI